MSECEESSLGIQGELGAQVGRETSGNAATIDSVIVKIISEDKLINGEDMKVL